MMRFCLSLFYSSVLGMSNYRWKVSLHFMHGEDRVHWSIFLYMVFIRTTCDRFSAEAIHNEAGRIDFKSSVVPRNGFRCECSEVY